MRLSCWFPVAAVVLVLAAAPPGHAQGIPDEATRDRVADWIERCDGDWSGACGVVDGYIVERMLGRWCRRLEVHWDTPRLVRSADVDHPAADVAARHRHRAQEFLEECVPIYAAALARAGTAASDRADAGDRVPGATAGQREVEATGRTMQVRTRSNVRSGPGMAHDRVEVLDAGTEVRVIGRSGDWAEIVTPGGGNGFIYGPLLAEAAPDRVATASGEEPASSPDTVAEAAAIGAQDIPDAATREWVADWILRCNVHSRADDCRSVGVRIKETAAGQRCWGMERLWGDYDLLRDPARVLRAMDDSGDRRREAAELLRECVPIYAAALDEAGAGDNLLLAEVTPDQATAAVEREPEPAIALEPKCTAELPDGSECWQELAERPGCHIYVLEYVHGLDPFRTWSGECADGLAEGEGRLEETFGEAYYIEWSATFAGGKATDKKLVKSTDLLEKAVVDGPSEQAGPPGEAPLLANTPPDLAQGIPDDARPSDNSGQACDAWEASYTVTWTEEGLQRGGINLTEVEAGFLTKTEAEDFVQSICSSRHSQYGPGAGVDYVLESCTVGEATCVQPRSHAQQPDPPGEAPGTDTPSVDVPSGSGPLHGSIAFSQEDDGAYAWGIAWSYDSSVGAESEAIGQCREYGGTRCAEAGWFQEACGALAIGDGNGYGAGWGATTAEAERDALARCRAANDDCRIEVARCSRSEEAGGSGRTDKETDTVVGRDPEEVDGKGRTEGTIVTLEGFSGSCDLFMGPGMQVGHNSPVLGAEHFTFEIPRESQRCDYIIGSLVASCQEWLCSSGQPAPEGRQCARHFVQEGIEKCGLDIDERDYIWR